jgi:hypothetical protein
VHRVDGCTCWGWKYPTGQFAQMALSLWANFPLLQVTHSVAPSKLVLPALQFLHENSCGGSKPSVGSKPFVPARHMPHAHSSHADPSSAVCELSLQ